MTRRPAHSRPPEIREAGHIVVYPGVLLGEGATLGPYVVLGSPPRGHFDGELSLVVGDAASIRSHTVIYAGSIIGQRFSTGHGVMIRESNAIGDDVSIGSHSVVEHHVRIGDRVRIHSNAFVPEFTVLEDDAWIGPNVVLTNALYPLGAGVKEKLRGPRVGNGAKIGANATILPGVVIGRRSLVGAGAVVVADVPEGKVVVGNPARVIKDVADIPDYGSTAE